VLLSKEAKTNIIKTRSLNHNKESITESSQDLRGASTKETFGTRSADLTRIKLVYW